MTGWFRINKMCGLLTIPVWKQFEFFNSLIMKKIVFIIFLFILASCKSSSVPDKKMVCVSILPQKYFVEKIAGDLVDINVLLPPGANPRYYSIMPSQMKEISRSSAWLRIGQIPFEKSWGKKIRQTNPKMKVYDTSARADWIITKADTVNFTGADPHIWMSPVEVKKIASESYKALIKTLPEDSVVLTANYKKWIVEIDSLNQEIKKSFKNLLQRKFIIFHPSLTYFARDYNLEQIPLEIEGKEPSARQMGDIINLAKKENIHIVLLQKGFNMDNAHQLAREINGKIIIIDPFDEHWEKQLRNISSIIISNQ